MTDWTNALANYKLATQIAAVIDSDKHQDAFVAAASTQYDTIEVLLKTPAPDLNAIAAKLHIMHRDGYQHMLAPVLADVERLAGQTAREPAWGEYLDLGYALPLTFPNVSPEIADAADRYRIAYFSKGDSAGADTSEAATRIADTQATSLPDLAAKIMLGMLECEPVHQGDRLIIDLADFPTDGGAKILLGAALDAVAMIASTEEALS